MPLPLVFCGAVACASSPAPAPTPEPVAAAPTPPPPAAEPEPAPTPVEAPLAIEAAPSPVAAVQPPAQKASPASKPAAKAKSAYTGPDPCTVAVGGSGIIDKACEKGGIKEAKITMKSMVKKAKKSGMKIDCDSCHKDEKDWSQFVPDVKEKFQALLEAYNK